ncbi:alpha-ketoacid dehydrogenase subunit beta [Wenzhouxiangella sp. AB-CW3]|uniref:alpha-ketoacid dehydrogenase subunit beta n=1 Tax=Wenzhouxiangella sp. AB-CW3 TaxID=2771012 RepID=UPI00168AD843|nr:alpha-ketoacid dehydrogenase subunit beta [Wenzhouxiangella sp. AB-CW3]QOC21292.1 alpha-ketoacid dehydrogenase subunit beta [Wenzhouxiangella sp. AB-CW3]
MAEITLIEGVTMALARAMEEDESVVVLGEDVGVNGGVFRATAGLHQRFGDDRVIDTPLAEVMIAGTTVGMAAQGMKPVAEAQFCGFTMPMIDHIMCHAGRLRNRTRGRLSCPMVLRFPSGGGIHAPEHHSESPEALYAHMPGIRVVIPSSPSRAYGLMLAAIRDPDPVIFMEPKRIYRWQKEEVVDDGEELPLDVCYTLRDGNDVTLVTWGAMIKETMQAADELEAQGVSVEVIDVATISPLDMETIIESVERTGRCVIVQEAPRHCSVASEIAAGLADAGVWHLHAPVKRVCGYDVVMPLYRNEMKYMPSVKRIVHAVQQVLEVS